MLPMYEIRQTDLTVKRNNYKLEFPEHIHKYIEIVYAYKGVQNVAVNGAEYAVTQGNSLVIFPDTVHRFSKTETSENTETEILVLMCDPKLFGNLFPDLGNFKLKNPLISQKTIPKPLKLAFEMIEPNQSFEIKFSWTCVIMSHILSLIKLERRPAEPIKNMHYKIIKYIEENFTEPITRPYLAKKFNVSECYISRLFSQKIKINLRNYLGIIRSEYAATLIRTTDEKLTVISQIAGFDSLRTFNRMFKNTYGQTPQEYRNNINNLMRKN